MHATRSSSASPPRQPAGCPVCGCSCRPALPAKRRASGDPLGLASARVGYADERLALRRELTRQLEAIEDLRRDLEEERSASSSAASEAMSMILRLQREKAEIQMESRQFRLFAEEKIAHDQNQIGTLEDECYRRERVVQALLIELSAYRNRLFALGLDPDNLDGDYPVVRCLAHSEKRDSPWTPRERLLEIEQRIDEMEQMGSGGGRELEVTEVIGTSPSVSRHSRRMSSDSAGSFLMPEVVSTHEQGVDDAIDRVCTVDTIHGTRPCNSKTAVFDDCESTPRSLIVKEGEEADLRKLYIRLQALEADRESLKQAIVSMRTEKAQMVLLKEIAENLSKGMVITQPSPRRSVSKRPFRFGLFSFLSALKFVFSFRFWTGKPKSCRYMFHYLNGRVGLLILLDKSQHARHLKCITRPIGCVDIPAVATGSIAYVVATPAHH